MPKIPVEFDEAKIDALFASFDRSDLPGVAVGISVGGKPVYRKGFGVASVELPLALSPSIRMRIGSTTKQFTAFAYMLLCEAGLASVDDPLEKHFPELHAVTRGVTMRQVMGNISGLRDATDIVVQSNGMAGGWVSTDDIVSLYREMDQVNSAPGTTWSYNNGGFVLLGVAVERIAGLRLEEVMRQRIFEPIGMYDTLLRRRDADFVPNSASTHRKTALESYEKVEYCGGIDYAGAGAIVSTVDDMLRWTRHMDSPVVGKAETWAAMRTPQTLVNGTSSGYGLGLITSTYRGAEVLHHAGGGLASNAQMIKVPAAGLDVVVMLNSVDSIGMLLAYKVLDTCLPTLEITAKVPGAFATGVFRSKKTGRVIQLYEAGDRQIVAITGQDIPVEARSDGTLWPALEVVQYKKVATLVGRREEPSAVRLNDFGEQDEFTRLPPPDRIDVARLLGRYRSDTTGIDAEVTNDQDGPVLETRGRFGSTRFKLEALANGIWRTHALGMTMPPGGILFAEGDSGVRFSNMLNSSISFRRVDVAAANLKMTRRA